MGGAVPFDMALIVDGTYYWNFLVATALTIVGAFAVSAPVLLGRVLAKPRAWFIVVAGAALAWAAELYLIFQGAIYLPLAVVGAVVVALAVAIALAVNVVAYYSTQTSSRGQIVQVITVLIAIPATVLAVSQVVAPGQLQAVVRGNCSGASVYGSELTAVTSSVGQNARTGPATTYPQFARYDSGCVLGFDSYCLGEPVIDATVGLPDVRWLRLHLLPGYVAAAKIVETSADAGLPNTGCAKFGGQTVGLDGKSVIERDPQLSRARFTRVQTHPVTTSLVGYAYIVPGATGTARVEQIGNTPKTADGSTVTARINLDQVAPPRSRASSIVLAVVPCLAALVPGTAAQYYEVSLKTGKSISRHPALDGLGARLRNAACRVSPDASPSALTASSKSSSELSKKEIDAVQPKK